ncbi:MULTISPECIES: nucleotidyltransferase domain-containing protein [Bacteria]
MFDSIRSFFPQNACDDAPAENRVTAVVHGSVARDDSNLDSDDDLLVVYPDGLGRGAKYVPRRYSASREGGEPKHPRACSIEFSHTKRRQT